MLSFLPPRRLLFARVYTSIKCVVKEVQRVNTVDIVKNGFEGFCERARVLFLFVKVLGKWGGLGVGLSGKVYDF